MSAPTSMPGRSSGKAGGTPARSVLGRVVVCLDGSEIGECVIPHAVTVARALGGSLTLIRVLEEAPGGAPADPLAWDIQRRESRDYLERTAGRREGEVSIDIEVIEGKAAEEICLWTRSNRVALTVLCSHGVSGQTDWSLASTAHKLVEGVSGSLLLVPAGTRDEGDVARYRRVLVPVDGSARAESVLPTAKRLADAERAQLILAHVVPVPELMEIGPLDPEDRELRERIVQRNERVANQYLDRLRAKLAGDASRVRTEVIRGGDPRTGLVRLIEEADVDLVVLSSHGRTARSDVPLGSVASHLVAHAKIPLLIMRRPAVTATRRLARAVPEAVRLPRQASP